MSFNAGRTILGVALLAAAVTGASAGLPSVVDEAPPPLKSAAVLASGPSAGTGFDGVVQAVRQTVLAAQVAGAVVSLDVKTGDMVKAGQVLLRLDARAAEQTASAGAAQVLAARAALEAAAKEFERQKMLFQQNYISQAALDRAEAQFKTSQAEAAAQLATAGASRTQSAFYVVRAPYDGVVAEVPVVLGDMAMPGRPLLTVYDPRALRVSAAVPQTAAASLKPGQVPQVELPGVTAGRITPVRVQWLPRVDPATHSLEVWLDLPAGLPGVAPGMFARAWLPADGSAGPRFYVPLQAVVRRAEMTAVYVLGADGRPLLRQVRLGRADADKIEVLAGVSAGERVALEPQAAARVR
jgi:RND family efflux transporter MFP subunit